MGSAVPRPAEEQRKLYQAPGELSASNKSTLLSGHLRSPAQPPAAADTARQSQHVG
jgi:hypothetical protein